LATIQQIAILHAPEAEGPKFESEAGHDDLGRALLMTRDLMDANRRTGTSREELLACMVQDQIRFSGTPATHYAARALYLYELGTDNPSDAVQEYLDLFEQAAGVAARDAILGGLCVEMLEPTDRLEIAAGWKPVPRAAACPEARQRECLTAFGKIRRATLQEVRDSIQRFEEGRPIRDWNLIALSKAPMVDLGSMGMFVVNRTALGRSLFDGVRHTVTSAALDGKLPDKFNDLGAVGRVYGDLFELYVQGVLEAACPGRVLNTTAPHNHGSSGTHDRNRSTRMPMFLRVRRVFLVCETRA